jgi:hypothetical protein
MLLLILVAVVVAVVQLATMAGVVWLFCRLGFVRRRGPVPTVYSRDLGRPVEVPIETPAAEPEKPEEFRPRVRATFERVESVANEKAQAGEVTNWLRDRSKRARG